MKRNLFFLYLFFYLLPTVAQNSEKIIFTRTEKAPEIDGLIDDDVWQKTEKVSGFKQTEPFWGASPTQETEVWILYDNRALYIAAKIIENSSDGISRQVGMRDNDDLHADYFAFEFDPFGQMQDAYYFMLTASGVQAEWRRSDESYNAVWKSKVNINDQGWTLEMEIPFSAFSFPKTEVQNWRVQFYRYIRRERELSEWKLAKQLDDNDIKYWAKSDGLSEIDPPLRLFLHPYANIALTGIPNQNGNLNWSNSAKGGLDMKWGINQSYTLDVSLLPDFSQVQSDNLVKNLSAFEVAYSENRPFFNESISFFNKGDLLYSRRIGKQASAYKSVYTSLDSNEHLISNPATAPLINAFKLYGRNEKGLAVGVFNAITNKTEAIIEADDLSRRKIQTEPLTNYTLFVIDQAFRNKSNLFFSNANTIRQGDEIQANVSALGGSYYFGNGQYKAYLLGGMSRRSKMGEQFWNKSASEGIKYDISLGKVSGKWIYSLTQNVKDKHYNPNDLGVNFRNDESANNITISRRVQTPFWKLLSFNQTLYIDYAYRLSTLKQTENAIRYWFIAKTRNHLSIWSESAWHPFQYYDYYEARKAGAYYLSPRYFESYLNFSSDYRRPFALDGSYSHAYFYDFNGNNHSFTITPVLRIGNNVQMKLKNTYSVNMGQRGFAGELLDESIVFGKRLVNTIENSYNINCMISNRLGLSFKGRYYWSQGEYSDFYKLQNDGTLGKALVNFDENYDFTYSVFNIDLTLQWEFAPGSMLFFTYKNEFINELLNADKTYLDYMRYGFNAEQNFTFALKLIYHFDVGTLLSRKK